MKRLWTKTLAYKVLLLFLVLGLLPDGLAALGQMSPVLILREAPAYPEHPAPSSTRDEWDFYLYLPLISRAPDPDSLPWVNTQSRTASRDFYQSEYQGSANSDSGWTGNHAACGAGTTSEAFRASILQRINYFRSMAGIPPLVGFNDIYNAKAQAAALMMSVNRSLSHSPDDSWACYTEAGAEGAGSSNLSLGRYGPTTIRWSGNPRPASAARREQIRRMRSP